MGCWALVPFVQFVMPSNACSYTVVSTGIVVVASLTTKAAGISPALVCGIARGDTVVDACA